MIFNTVKLPHPHEAATLTAICISNTEELQQTPRRAVVVFPGGGYSFLSDREAEPIATQFLAAGFQTFILRYTVKEGAKDYAPLQQAALSVRYVREHAAEYNVDPDYVFVCGFSAGGHLAASAGTLWNCPAIKAVMGDAPEGIGRPTGMILSYPVISGDEWAHKGSIHRLCGTDTPTKEESDRFSIEKHVDATTSPAFLWHTTTDQVVPVQNSILMASALAAAKVPFEMHIFPEGKHGLSLCNEQTASGKPYMISPHNECWLPLAIRWAKELQV